MKTIVKGISLLAAAGIATAGLVIVNTDTQFNAKSDDKVRLVLKGVEN